MGFRGLIGISLPYSMAYKVTRISAGKISSFFKNLNIGIKA
jgi:hypothetical protein